MTNEYQIRVVPEVAAQEDRLKRWLADEYGIDVRTIYGVRVLKRSIDARQRQIYVNLKVRVYVNEQPHDDEFVRTEYPNVEGRPQVIVVGAGPGGLFAALRLIELGYRPIVLERGKDVHERKKDLALITKTQKVDAESNYCFGEGGAGAYSDGKLYTRSKNRDNTDKILNVFCQHGASTAILADAHPHIGTDRLPKVIEAMRNTIINCGGEVHFKTKMTQLIVEGDKVIGCVADKEYKGCTLQQMQQAYAEWDITSFSPAEIEMSRTLSIYCPDHLVVLPDGAGVLGVYENKYGDGYALRTQLDIPITDLPENVRETVYLGVGFATDAEIESWLETLES